MPYSSLNKTSTVIKYRCDKMRCHIWDFVFFPGNGADQEKLCNSVSIEMWWFVLLHTIQCQCWDMMICAVAYSVSAETQWFVRQDGWWWEGKIYPYSRTHTWISVDAIVWVSIFSDQKSGMATFTKSSQIRKPSEKNYIHHFFWQPEGILNMAGAVKLGAQLPFQRSWDKNSN